MTTAYILLNSELGHEAEILKELKMIEMAHKLEIDEIPPLVELKVLEEDEQDDSKEGFARQDNFWT